MENLIERINFLAKKSKAEGLSPEEKLEQDKLRQEYLKNFRSRMKASLKNVTIVNDEGEDVTPEKLRIMQKKDKLN